MCTTDKVNLSGSVTALSELTDESECDHSENIPGGRQS